MIDAPHVKKSYFRVRKSSKFLAALVFTIFLLPYLPISVSSFVEI